MKQENYDLAIETLEQTKHYINLLVEIDNNQSFEITFFDLADKTKRF